MHDDKEIRDIQKKMQECLRDMRRLAPLVGAARTVKEFNPDQRKNALASVQIKYIQRGESVAGAEVCARADPTYLEQMKTLKDAHASACGTIAEWEAVFARFEGCRSMLAMSRETMRTLEG